MKAITSSVTGPRFLSTALGMSITLFPRADTTALRGAFSWLRPVRARCLLVGHDDYLSREPHRLLLRCGECGRRTPGWSIGMSPPRVTAPALVRTPALVTRRAIR